MITREQAAELRRLVREELAAYCEIRDYMTWRHPEAEVSERLEKKSRAARAAVNAYIDELTEEKAEKILVDKNTNDA